MTIATSYGFSLVCNLFISISKIIDENSKKELKQDKVANNDNKGEKYDREIRIQRFYMNNHNIVSFFISE